MPGTPGFLGGQTSSEYSNQLGKCYLREKLCQKYPRKGKLSHMGPPLAAAQNPCRSLQLQFLNFSVLLYLTNCNQRLINFLFAYSSRGVFFSLSCIRAQQRGRPYPARFKPFRDLKSARIPDDRVFLCFSRESSKWGASTIVPEQG